VHIGIHLQFPNGGPTIQGQQPSSASLKHRLFTGSVQSDLEAVLQHHFLVLYQSLPSMATHVLGTSPDWRISVKYRSLR
jgi:hypothetical protein